MRQSYWKPQHEVFIRSMLKHEDPTKAYKAAYPKASAASARVGGHRLFRYPHIRRRIESIITERSAERHKRAVEEGAERERRQNERRHEMRVVLCKLMRGKLKKKRVFIVRDQPVTIEDAPDTGTILNAITLDLRLEAGYSNWPLIEARFARIMASLVPGEKWQQRVINSEGKPAQASISAECPGTALLQKISPIAPVISTTGRTFSPKVNLPKCGDSADRGTSGDFSLRSTSLRSVRNDALIFQEHPVMISPSKPARARPAGNLKTARFTRAVTKTGWLKLKKAG